MNWETQLNEADKLALLNGGRLCTERVVERRNHMRVSYLILVRVGEVKEYVWETSVYKCNLPSSPYFSEDDRKRCLAGARQEARSVVASLKQYQKKLKAATNAS